MKRIILTCLLSVILTATSAAASVVTFNFTFSGDGVGSPGAKATGSISFDQAKLGTTPGRFIWDPSGIYDLAHSIDGLVTALSVTVTGTDANGSYTLRDFVGGTGDFSAVVFDTSGMIGYDLSRQLVGKSMKDTDKSWGIPDPIMPLPGPGEPILSYSGDFELFVTSGYGGAAPTGIYPFQLGSNAGAGDSAMQLTSYEAVPEPSTFLLLGAGIGGLAFLIRRK